MLALALHASFWIGLWHLVPARWSSRPLDRTLASVVVGLTAIVIALEALGSVGSIGRVPVAVLCLSVGAAGWVARGRRRLVAPDTPHDVYPSRSGGTMLVVVALVACGIVLAALVRQLVLGVLLPVQPISDAPIYHLYFAARWWHSGALSLVPTPFGEEAAAYFPANGDLWLTWLMATGAGPFVKVGQWPFAIVGGLALFGIARGAGADRPAAALPAAAWAGLPLVMHQASLANVDLLWTACLLCAVHFLLRWQSVSGVDLPMAWLVGLACGLVIGSKTFGLLLAAPTLALAVVHAARRPAGVATIVALGAGVLLPSAFFYARNAWLTGNPVYPLHVAALGRTWLDGWYTRAAMEATAYHLPTGMWWLLPARLAATLGLTGLSLVVAGLAAGLAFAVTSRTPGVRRVAGACVALGALQTLAYWYVIPYNTQERFLSAALGLSVVPLAFLASSRRWGVGVVSVLVTAQVVLALHHDRVSLQSVLTTTGTAGDRFYPREDFADRLRPGWEILDRLGLPDGTRIAYAGTNLPYYLLGPASTWHVEYVNVMGDADWLPHDYHNARLRAGVTSLARDPWPQWYRTEPDPEIWLSNLLRRGIDILFVARENRHGRLDPPGGAVPRFPIEKAWADARPDRFIDLGPHVYEAGTIPWVRVYRVVRTP